MSAKRPATDNIDQKTLEHQENGTSVKQDNKNNQTTANQRQIVTVKKEGENGTACKADDKKADNNEATAKPSLFSNMFTNNATTINNQGTGLFQNTTSSLFANNGTSSLFSKPTTGLFTNNGPSSNQPKTGGLFGNLGSTSNNSGSIFNFQSGGVPPIKNTGSSLFGSNLQQNDQDDSGDSAQLEAAQNLEADPTKSTHHYKYEETCKLIIKQKAFKFKKIGNDLIENVDVVVTQDKQSKTFYITVQLPATKKSIYTGLLLPNKSQVKHLNNKKENVEVSAFMIVNKKPEQAILRCQFQKQDQGVQLHDTIEKIVKGTYESKQEGDNKESQKQAKTQEKKQAASKKV